MRSPKSASFKFGGLSFFLYMSLEISPKLSYILYVCALARLISASSKEKNTSPYRFVFKFEVKFANFGFKFDLPRPAS